MAESHEGAGRDVSGRVVPGLVVLWGCVLLVAYALEHAALEWPVDSSARTMADGPGLLSALGAAARSVIVAIGILGASVGYGSLIASFGLGSLGFGWLADRCAELMLGGGIVAVAVFAMGHSRLLTPAPAVVLVAGGWTAMAVTMWRAKRPSEAESAREGPKRKFDPIVALAALGIGVASLLALLVALAPPTARDALSYHLAAPKAYISANGIVELPWSVHSYLPFATEMLYTLGLLLGPDTSSNLIHLGYGCAVVALVVVVTQGATGSARWGFTAGAMVATVPSVIWNAGIAHNEMWMALAVTVAALALGRWWETGDRRLLLWTGIAIGIALSAKHTALLLAPILGIVVLFRARSMVPREQARTLGWSVVSGCAALAFPLPWYAQNVARTGNPVFPYFWGLFPTHSPVWDGARADVFDAYLRISYGQHDGVLSWMRLPWDVSVRAQNDVTSLFDGVVGPAFLFLAPVALVLLFRANVPSWLRVATTVAIAFAVVWATQSQQLRFLVPVLPVLAVAGATAAAMLGSWKPSLSRVGAAIAVPLAVMLAMNLAIASLEVVAAAPHRPVLGLESRSTYLARRLAYFSFYERLNREIGPGQRVLLVDMRNDGYYLDVPFVSDSVLEDYTIGRIVNGAASPADVRDSIVGLGVTHMLIREDILLDPRFTPFDGAQAAARWSGFLQANAERLAARDGMALYALKN